MRRADMAVYAAKRRGRNCVVVANAADAIGPDARAALAGRMAAAS
jgi:hypothetical protein